jgi:MoaA/NifB/PqqE/SkfB family radical SAM enzyme
MKNDAFCILPFSHLNAYPNKKLKVCCYSQKYLDIDETSDDVVELFNSETYKEVRKKMLKGEKPSYCDICYNMEKEGSFSYRQQWNTHYADFISEYLNNTDDTGFIKPNFLKLDLRPSTNCNYSCRSCSSESSTKWAEEDDQFFKEHPNLEKSYDPFSFNKTTNFDIHTENLKNLEHIYFAGGEPLYMKEMYKFLDSIENKSKIELHINTNFSLLNFVKEDIFKFLSEFRFTNFIISVDGLGEIGEFVRTGFSHEKFCNNLKKLEENKSKYSNIRNVFQYTSSIFNCYDFYNFRQQMYDLNFITSDDDILFNYAVGSERVAVTSFSNCYEVADYFEKNIHQVNGERLKTHILRYINFLRNNKLEDETQILYTLIDFENRLNFGNKFNKTEVPQELSYLKQFSSRNSQKCL